jgi:hypothetical protein
MNSKEKERLAGIACDRTAEEMDRNGWAPLTKNEDCLALQAYLRIDVRFSEGFSQVIARRAQDKDNDDMWGVVGYGMGTAPYPWPHNIREAVVEAAWRIGRIKERRAQQQAPQ